MNIALFGGTFDPIHRGHLNVARAAAERFKLKEVWFVPADIPPHKQKAPVTSFFHRYSMVALALAGEPDFLPSLLEAPDPEAHVERRPSYSIDTIRKVKAGLRKSDRLYFLIGIDAFREIGTWYKAEELLRECDIIVAARPGYSLDDVVGSLPKGMRPKDDDAVMWQKSPSLRQAQGRLYRQKRAVERGGTRRNQAGLLELPGVRLHLLPETHEDVSATQIRTATRRGTALKKLVPDAVAEYIRKEGLYRGMPHTKAKQKIGRGGSGLKRPTQAKSA
ncbi:MAG TPA: nicotinate-nucleotide adenylyltransferase [Candidatus Limnocylindrales bacterium]|nr:nicotinate-nucleotide adenylyltransferase [Candidatus Limnocylindrales bacterium]